MTSLELEQVSVSVGDRPVLERVTLSVADGERLVVLGPSGSGKTTLLRAVAGLCELTHGRVLVDGRDVTDAPTRQRDLALVDQPATLHPHLDVRGNLELALRLRDVPDPEVARRVDAGRRTFSLTRLLRRRPDTLTPGDRQQVAVARTFVRPVGLLLLDEPLVRTDPRRRRVLVRELLGLADAAGTTLVVATCDPATASALAERVAVLDGGRVVQVGDLAQLRARPATTAVATTLDAPPMNLVPGRVERSARGTRVVAGPLRITSFALPVRDLAGRAVTVGIRPSDLQPVDDRGEGDGPAIVIEEVVRDRTFLGSDLALRVGGPDRDEELVAVVPRPGPELGALVRLTVDPRQVHLFSADGRALAHGV